jgi:RES domain-containing protein
MQLYRICRTVYAKDISGTGARIYGGRWNSPGLPAIYTAQSVSLALLEMLAHTPSLVLQKDCSIVCLDIMGKLPVTAFSADDLSTGWNQYPAPASLAKKGDKWLRGMESLLLKVPSVVVPSEFNFIINPLHPDMGRVKITTITPLVIDIRIASRLA